MSTHRVGSALVALLITVGLAAPGSAQQTLGVGPDFMGYSFGSGLSATAAQLFIFPIAARVPVGQKFTADLYGAWADGRVKSNSSAYTLSGLVDTRLKASYQATPWALVSLGVSLPTGKATHTNQEAVVASVLSTDLLGFQESNWGTGLAVITSVATAYRVGAWGVGLAGAYSAHGEFKPYSAQDLKYQPGNETRVRLGVDRNVGQSGTFTAGATLMSYSSDQAAGRNLFQAGKRLRFDATYLFRAGAGVWTLYGADLWRQNGDLTLQISDLSGNIQKDTTLATPTQNLLIAGVVGAVGLGSSYVFRPQLDLRLQQRQAVNGVNEGSGWIVGVGGDLPIRLFRAYDFFPKARFLVGSITDPTGNGVRVTGAEISATLRWGF
jgi:hypothetical protein